MRLFFTKKIFFTVASILCVSWLLLNYFLFTRRGVVGFHPDFRTFLDWSWQGQHAHFHQTFGNYMPVYPYLSYLYTLLFEDYESMLHNAYILKSVVILFDVTTYALIVSFIKPGSVKKAILLGLLLAINVSIIYNSVFWGQVDGIHSFFLLLSFYFTTKNKWVYVGIAFTLAFFTKIVSVVFLPVFGLYLVNEVISKRAKKRELFYAVLAIIVTALCLSLPIVLSGNLPGMMATHVGFISAYHPVSGNAYNVWILLTQGRDLMMTQTGELFFRNITFQQVSMFLFVPFYAMAIWPLLSRVYQSLRLKQSQPIEIEKLLLVCVLVPLVFFYFSTKIRERYAHPYLVFLTLYCFYHRRYILWILATSIYFLQLEAVLGYTKTLPGIFVRIHQETHVYSPVLISALFLALIAYLLHLLFATIKSKHENVPEQLTNFSVWGLTDGLRDERTIKNQT